MSSILTNNSAMVALQTLKSVNSSLQDTQSQISTGKKVESASDNSAVWAISKVMESDVKGFQGIQESLSLGESTVAVALNASETVTDLLNDIKGRIVSAQEDNVDREKIQADIDALRDQIGAVVGAAQFNGLNLVQGTEDVNVLSSLDRSNNGDVTAENITVNRQDLTTQEGSLGTGTTTNLSANITASSATISSAAVRNDGAAVPTAADIGLTGDFSADSLAFNIGGTSITFAAGELSATAADAAQSIADAINAAQIEGISVNNNAGTLEFASTRDFEQTTISVTQGGASAGTLSATSVDLDQRAESFTLAATNVNEGDGYQISLSGGVVATYVASGGETMEDVAKGLKAAIDADGDADIRTLVNQNSSGEWVLNIATSGSTNETATIVANANDGDGDAVVTGGLAGLDGIDVSTSEGADKALENIETLIQNSIDAAASFGSVQGRIETQSEFIGALVDSFKSGIGSLVDADLEETSARLQALQVQQQLATQSLSIANQAPQNILALFR
ncbi:flagellin [Gymnodinialimonas mytili]|uniref:flagellin n=1 Tax=Gymnodinialimonas mytili TaxID=3126503 RepID=UPI003F72751E